ncbi:MAG: hypothetical protein K0R54_1701 [Clostridiaceae bacterium]|jgi:predicted transcriptional regulator|nr:hypothetical protein [Clostridiaceae bacterium]
MPALDQYRKYNVRFIVHPPFEFGVAMYIMANAEQYLKYGEDNDFIFDKMLLEFGKNYSLNISEFIQNELHFFMCQDVRGLPFVNPLGRLIFGLAMDNPELASVEEFVKFVHMMDENQFLQQIIKSAISQESMANEIEDYVSATDIGKEQAIDLIRNSSIQETKQKEKLIYCLQNPLEIKTRFSLLIKQFYELMYKLYEHDILLTLKPIMEKYEKLFNDNPEEFMRDFLRIDISNYRKEVRVHVSYLIQVLILYFMETDDRIPDYFIIGIYADKRFGRGALKDKLITFSKVLSDKKRFELIILLSKRPWYVQELAEQLNIASSTVSHHLSLLISLNLVKPERDEHRLYYLLDKDKVKDFLEQISKMLFEK